MAKIEPLINIAKSNSCKFLEKEPMKNHTSFKIGGIVDLFIEVPNIKALIEIVAYCKEHSINFRVIGNGSNILVSDEGLNGAVIKLCKDFSNISLVDNDKILCGSAVKLSKLCEFALKNSLSGLEFAFGIPGSVGGAVFMNAGAYGGEIKDVLLTANHLNQNFKEQTLDKADLDLSYRHSIYCETDYIITGALFGLKKGSQKEIKERMNDFISRRREKQPLEFPSAGSTFKRPKGHFAAALIEECELKGAKIGGAMVSTKHSGFIINYNNASFNEVDKLIKHIKNVVFNKKGIKLKCEVHKWED
jgi:UDP-N-acetylmuramate dehydrogenase